MSDEINLTKTLQGEWWFLAAVLTAIYRYPMPHPHGRESTVSIGLYGKGARTENRVTKDGETVGAITLAAVGFSTTVSITAPAAHEAYWHEILSRLEEATTTALQARYFAGADPIDHAIQEYYDRRAKGEKITLKEIAEQNGLSYDYLRKRKSQYDQTLKRARAQRTQKRHKD